MNFIISGKNIEVTSGLKDAIEQKLGKLERYFTPETEIIVTLSVEKGRQKIEVTIPVKGHIIRSEQTSSDMYVSIDLVEEVIERQLRKYKNKLVARSQGHPTSAVSAGGIKKEFIESEEASPEDDDTDCPHKTFRHQTHVSGRCMSSDGTSGTQFLRILQCRNR